MRKYEDKKYRNILNEYGYSIEEIENRLDDVYNTIFYGTDCERLYHECGNDMAYFVDTGNNDVRTEGMSYAMMMCVQRDMKQEFNKLWKWAKKYLWMESGINKGYFAWSVSTDGVKNSDGPAPDGEEYFALALFFASHRWGDGEGIFNYSKEAKDILHECIHKGEDGEGKPMWNPENKLIKFVPNLEITDPSYHLPHFYELFALWANEDDREFWREAANNSREYLKMACNHVTGLAPEYSYYNGEPYCKDNRQRYYSDSYRVIGNLALDYYWFEKEPWECECINKIQVFFNETVKGKDDLIYEIDGTIINEKALHPIAIIATNAMGSIVNNGKYSKACIEKFWNTSLRTGTRRYYDNCLYIFALLALSGNYRVW